MALEIAKPTSIEELTTENGYSDSSEYKAMGISGIPQHTCSAEDTYMSELDADYYLSLIATLPEAGDRVLLGNLLIKQMTHEECATDLSLTMAQYRYARREAYYQFKLALRYSRAGSRRLFPDEEADEA